MAEKRTRRTRAELRELMMSAGKEVLFKIEPSLGFEALTYSAVFEHLQENYDQKVTIGSVHERIWASQRDFQLAVLGDTLREPIDPGTHQSLGLAFEAIEAGDLSTVQGRKQTAREAVRLSSHYLAPRPHSKALEIAHIIRFRLWSLGHDHPEAMDFAETLISIRRSTTDAYASVVRALMGALGLRTRADAGDPDEVIEAIALLGNAATIGVRTDVLEISMRPRLIPSGPNGEQQEWYPDAVALWAFVQSMLEVDDDTITERERHL